MARQQGFVTDTRTQISAFLAVSDSWSGLQQEYLAMLANGTLPVQADLDAVFGLGVLTVAQYTTVITQMQTIIDSVHVPATRNLLYRLKQ